MYCECEHFSHQFEPNEVCSGKPTVEVATDFGTYRVCAECADDHLIEYHNPETDRRNLP